MAGLAGEETEVEIGEGVCGEYRDGDGDTDSIAGVRVDKKVEEPGLFIETGNDLNGLVYKLKFWNRWTERYRVKERRKI